MSRAKAKVNYGEFVLLMGTPNELKQASKGTLNTVVGAARKELNTRLRHAEKFDSRACGEIRYALDGIGGLTPYTIKPDSPRIWEFPFMGIVMRIEIRKA